MICPIRFIRKPEEAECICEKCSFWLEEEDLSSVKNEPERFHAILSGPQSEQRTETGPKTIGKCSVLAIAESLNKRKP
jgi:hypothetical protein